MNAYELAYEYALHTSCSIFLTGKAGTGKTTFLRRLKADCPKQICVVAPTGVAAINAEGVTIHSLFQLPPQVFLPTDSAYRQLFKEMQMREQKRRVIRNLELLVIDEVSMVRADLLDAMDAVLRHIKRRPDQPFGGIQVLFIGDLFQLSPVARQEDWQLLREWYQGPYFFQARVFKQLTPMYIELDRVFRQTNHEFVELLNQVRENQLSAEGLRVLNERFVESIPKHDDTIVLSTHNRKVDAINQEQLAALNGRTYTFTATINKTFPESMYPMDEVLVLKKGARVMFTKNDSSLDKAYYNGKLGTVVELSADRIVVESPSEDGKHTHKIVCHRETWENIRYTAKENSEEIEPEVVGTFTQFPLRTAWAITIHKAQGLTFQKVTIDAEDAFAAGQIYVALSRCRSLEGIQLTSKIPSRALTNAREVIQFTSNQPSIEWVEEQLPSGERKYLCQLLCSLFRLNEFILRLQSANQWIAKATLQNPASVYEMLPSVIQHLVEEEHTLSTFRNQLSRIFAAPEPDSNYLTERIVAASGYFSPRLEEQVKLLHGGLAVEIVDEDEQREWHTILGEIITDLERQIFVMRELSGDISVAKIFSLRKKFAMSRVTAKKKSSVTPYSKTKASENNSPELPTALLLLRGKTLRAIARERHLSLQTVCRHIMKCLKKGIIRPTHIRAADRKILDAYQREVAD